MNNAPERIKIVQSVIDEYGLDQPDAVWYREGPVTEYVRSDLAPQCQPIESAPKDGKSVLVFTTGESCDVAFYYKNKWVIAFAEVPESDLICEPTHWMPLPKGPT